MTANSEASKQRAVDYLKRSLQLNPLYESEKIVRYRSQALGLSKPKTASAKAISSNLRARIIQGIDRVRAACWTEPVEPLIEKLQKLTLDEHPDLKRTADRLLVILTTRRKLPELASHKHFDEKFLNCFKQILTLPPRELAIPREQVIASFRNKKLRKRGMRMIALLEKEVPKLCQLEQEWLSSLKRQKVNRDILIRKGDFDSAPNHAVGAATKGGGSSWWTVGIVIFFILQILKALARNSG